MTPSRGSETLYRAFGRREFFEFLTLPLISGEMLEKSKEGPLRNRIDVQVA